jgi:hypothetical protein
MKFDLCIFFKVKSFYHLSSLYTQLQNPYQCTADLSSSSFRHPTRRAKKKQEQKTNTTRPITLFPLSHLPSHPTILIPASVIPNFVFFSKSKSLYSCSRCCFFPSFSSISSLLPLLCVRFLVFCHSELDDEDELFRDDEGDLRYG